MKPTYLDGIKVCELKYQEGLSFLELSNYIYHESSLLDYHWDNWVSGFVDAIAHFERLEGL